MGKFSAALKKSESVRKEPSPKPAPKKLVKTTAETVDTLRLDITAPQGPAEVSPLPEGRVDPRLVSFMEPGSPAGECFKMLRAKILTTNSKSRPRTIMVTSPQPLDGKTTVAVNLAINIAQGINEHVMLVDCDLRRSSVDRYLGLNGHKGIREYLEEGTSVAPYLTRTSMEKLTLLPAGKPAPNPSELLSSEKMHHLVGELKDRYKDRYIIFDTTPAKFAAETTFLASMVDGVVLVVRSGKTADDMVLEAIENIGRDRIFGLVFNATKESAKDYGYYYRYYQKVRK
jgi:exopolysaccharide/PEP-CTERM locus tyrosine autokinase